MEVGREALVLVAQAGAASVQEDEREESELEELEEENSTQPTLTARTSEEKDSLDGEEESEAGRRFRNIEEWNFSSVQTVDEKSLDEVGFITHPAVSLLSPVGSSEGSDRQDLQERQGPSTDR